MKTTTQTPPPAIPDFPGIVLCPETGRKIALQADIFAGLGLGGAQVKVTGATIRQKRFYDVLEVIEGRKKVGKKGPRPRQRGESAAHTLAEIEALENLKPEALEQP